MSEPASEETSLPFRPSDNICALLLNGSQFDRSRIRRLSKNSGFAVQIDEVGTIGELEVAVQGAAYDVIMIDYRLPNSDGLEALARIMKTTHNRDAAKIMITGDGAVDIAVRAMQAGCHDFLTKDAMNAAAIRNAMMNAMTQAYHHRQRQLQADYQRDIIRQGIVAAIQDGELQESIAAMLQGVLARSIPAPVAVHVGSEAGDVSDIVAAMFEPDEFVFIDRSA